MPARTMKGSGGLVLRTTDGTTWTQVQTDGFGNATNTDAYTMSCVDVYLVYRISE